jgi:hypothetical protein
VGFLGSPVTALQIELASHFQRSQALGVDLVNIQGRSAENIQDHGTPEK